MEIMMLPTVGDYLYFADQRLERADSHNEPEEALAAFAGAQVSATQAVAAALIRLAEAVESLRS